MNDFCTKIEKINCEIKDIEKIKSALVDLCTNGVKKGLFDTSFGKKELHHLDEKIISLNNEKVLMAEQLTHSNKLSIDDVISFTKRAWKNDLLYSIYSIDRIENENIDNMSKEDLIDLQNLAFDWSGIKFPLEQLAIVKAYNPQEKSRDLFFVEFLLIPGFVYFIYGTTKADSCLNFMPNENALSIIEDVLCHYI